MGIVVAEVEEVDDTIAGSSLNAGVMGSSGRSDPSEPWEVSLARPKATRRFFYRDGITWLEFAPVLNAQLCDAFESGVGVTVVDAGDGRRYEVDFRKLTQKNVATEYVRSICLEDVHTGIRIECEEPFEVRERRSGSDSHADHLSMLPRDFFQDMRLWKPQFDPFKKYGWPVGTNCIATTASAVPGRRKPMPDPSVCAPPGFVSLDDVAPQVVPFESKAEDFFGKLGDKVTALHCGDSEYVAIANMFQQGLSSQRWNKHPKITAVHKISIGQSKLAYFMGTMAEMEQVRGEANLKYAWHGTSADSIVSIVMYGFGQRPMPINGNAYGSGVYLAPCNRLDVSAGYAVMDANKEQHMLLCEVLLGQSEEIAAGSYCQFLPSSVDYDTGTDNLRNPSLHVIWSPFINSHILPWYIVSFTSEVAAESSVGSIRKARQAPRFGPYVRDPHTVFSPQSMKHPLCPPGVRTSVTHSTQGIATLATAMGYVGAGMSQGLLSRIVGLGYQPNLSEPQNSSPSMQPPSMLVPALENGFGSKQFFGRF